MDFLNKIYNEDCLVGLKKIPDNSIDLVLIDPPYDICTKCGKQGNSRVAMDVKSLEKELGQDTMFLSLARNRLSQNSISKRKKILSLLYELKNKRVIIFTGFTKQAESLGIPYYHSKCRSAKSLSDFNNKKFNHLALAVAGKVGANYTDLDSVILSNFTGNDATNRQLLDRAAKLDYHNKVADLHIICLNEPNEVKKLQNTLKMLDQNKIKWKT